MTGHAVHASIDIGYSGAIAKFSEGELMEIWDMPVRLGRTGKKQLDYEKLVEILGHRVITDFVQLPVYVEYVAAMPGQGVTSMFNFGVQVGAVRGILETFGHDVRLITPKVWKGHFGLHGLEKEDARQYALKVFSNKADLFKRKKDHGRADAALIGLAGYQLSEKAERIWNK